MSGSSTITGWGKYVPAKVLTNADLERMVETNNDWIVSRTGIRERRIAGPGESASTMALAAAHEALKVAGITAQDLGMIIVATVCPDYHFPSVGCIIQAKLGAHCPAFDIEAACSGFLYGLSIAHQFVRGGAAKHVLVIGAEKLSMYVDYTDRATCVLFGDGPGAAVVSGCEAAVGFHSFTLGSDGARPELLYVPTGGSAEPITEENLRAGQHCIKMMGSEVFKFATRAMDAATDVVIGEAGITPGEIDLFLPHQANQRIIEATAKRLGLPIEKVFLNIDRYGNTSAASIPIAMCEAIEQGRVWPGAKIVFAAFGGGLTWGAAAMTWTAPTPKSVPAVVNPEATSAVGGHA
jgi:3-oxoacyl-[acyl-carrier-protein] synthase-3